MEKRRIIVLLGMHRSGTSLTASILQALGVSLGDDLLPANTSNEKGYFENTAITRTHIRINRILDRRPFTSAGLVEYPEDFQLQDDIQECIDELENIVRLELEAATGTWGFKDPHTAKLLPVWNLLFERLDIEPIFILALRHPSAVAASTSKRDCIEPDYGELLWVDNNVAALRNTDYRISLVTDYSQWFSDPLAQARRILELPCIDWSGSDDELHRILDRCIDPELHHQHHLEKASLPLAQDLYDRLNRVIGENDTREHTAGFVDRYMTSKHMFAPAWDRLQAEWVLGKSRKEKLSGLEASVKHMENRIRKQEKMVAGQEQVILELRTRLKTSRDRLEEARQRIWKLQGPVKSILASKPGRLLMRYQVLNRRISGKSAGGAPLVRLQNAINDDRRADRDD